MTILCSDYPRIMLELPRIVFLIGGSIQGVSAEIWRFQISWQAQYLVRLEGDLIASRIGNVVSYAMRMKDAIHCAWQAQYLLSLKGDFPENPKTSN